MAINRYLSLDGLVKYDSLIKTNIDESVSEKKNKDLIIEFADSERTTSTKTVAEIANAAEFGTHVKFFDGNEYLDMIGCSVEDNFAIFYTDYYLNGEWNIKSCAIVGSTVIENVTEKFNYAEKKDIEQLVGDTPVSEQINNALVAVSLDTIDEICGGTISYADDVMF